MSEARAASLAPRREYFRQGRFRVTADMVRAWNRSIQLSTIEGVSVTRPLFLMALAGCTGFAGVCAIFGDLLYAHEIIIMLLIGGGILAFAWRVGTLRVYSKLTRDKGWHVYWWITPLRQMQDAIEAAMEDLTEAQAIRRNQGGGVSGGHGGHHHSHGHHGEHHGHHGDHHHGHDHHDDH